VAFFVLDVRQEYYGGILVTLPTGLVSILESTNCHAVWEKTMEYDVMQDYET
jgi:hypothetical protein